MNGEKWMPQQLPHRLVLQTPVRTPDGGGGWVTDWQDIQVLSAVLREGRGQKQYLADQKTASAELEAVLRYHPEVRTTRRFLFGAQVLEILHVRNIRQQNRWLVCRLLESPAE